MSQIKKASHARAIRRGIEYTRREIAAARGNSLRAQQIAFKQTDRYASYLGPVENLLFEKAALRTILNKSRRKS